MTPYYDHAGVVIYHADCRDVLPTLADKSIGLIATDPPYGVGIRYGDAYQDLSGDAYWAWFRPVLEEMRRAAVVVAFTHRTFALRDITDWDWVGIWEKPLSMGAHIGNSPVLPHWEPIFLYGIHALGTRSGHRSDVFRHNPQWSGGARNGEISPRLRGKNGNAASPGHHPTPKPLNLYREIISTFCPNEPATVLDPFMGSGTTLRAAKDLGRRAIGIEVEESYCEIAALRLQQEVLL